MIDAKTMRIQGYRVLGLHGNTHKAIMCPTSPHGQEIPTFPILDDDPG